MERTLVPPASTSSPAAEGELSPALRDWVAATLGNRQAGAIAVRPYEFDSDLEVLSETNNVAQVLEDEMLGRAFSAKMTSFYFVQADRNFNTGDAFVMRRPVLMGEMVTVHASESDAASFLTDFRDFAVNRMGSLSQSYLQGQFPTAQPRVQQDTGFGIAAEEFAVVADFDLGNSQAPGRPQLYIMVARQSNVNLALMVLYLDSQPRLRPFGLMDRLVGKVT